MATLPSPSGKVAGVAGLEPVTSAVTGQRSNQLSYTPARELKSNENLPPKSTGNSKIFLKTFRREWCLILGEKGREAIRAADAKEVGVGNPAEETYCYPNTYILRGSSKFVNARHFLRKRRLFVGSNHFPGTQSLARIAGNRVASRR